MQIKKRLKLILLSALICMCCLFVAFGFTMKSSTTASADTTPRYNVQFDYTNNKILSNLGNNTTTKYRSGTNVSTASVLDNDGTNMTFRIYAYGSDYSGSGILTNGGWIGSSTVNISFSSTYTDHTITVKDGSGKEIKKLYEIQFKQYLNNPNISKAKKMKTVLSETAVKVSEFFNESFAKEMLNKIKK